jgi:eukaryotic-like serine/threonine-protein kinase
VNEEEGIAVAPDGRSLITSVGTQESTVWVHDRGGDHQITSEGRAYFEEPDGVSGRQVFSPDGSRVFYMVDRRPQGSASELWSTEIATGKSAPVVSEPGLFGFDISPDGRNVVYSVGAKDGARALWSARVDHLLSPRKLTASGNELSPVFTPDGNLVFMSREGDESFLYWMKADGSERRKIYAPPVIQLETISPDGRWAVVQAAIENEDVPRGILAIPLEGGTPVRICTGLCVVRWPRDGESMFLSVIGGSPGHMLGWGTYIVPLTTGQVFPKLPPMGIASKADAAALPGAKSVESFVLPGLNEEIYAFSRTTVHRNLFQIPVP